MIFMLVWLREEQNEPVRGARARRLQNSDVLKADGGTP
jgi:hypothetical protein